MNLLNKIWENLQQFRIKIFSHVNNRLQKFIKICHPTSHNNPN
jgi:hypothetical protein